MKRFNPTAPARAAIGEGLIYRDVGRSVFKKLAARADLAPGSQQLVVGGIGSGKTTELLLAEQELSALEQTLSLYIDVSSETDLSAVNSGVLLVSLGIHLWRAIKRKSKPPEDLANIYEAIKDAAYGYEKQVWISEPEPDFDDYGPDESDYEPGYFQTIKRPGKLRPPFPAIRRDVKDLTESVSKLTNFLKEQGRELVVIFDGLDRLIKVDQFWSVAEQDLRAMKPLEISVLAAGPLSIMYGQGRQIKDYFDEVHYLPPAVADPKESPFLFEILRVRGAEELMHRDEMQRLCLASGGVLRDLISLARNAGENAYLDDADTIKTSHVDRSIEQLGNSYLLGLGTDQKTLLRSMLNGKGFTPSDPESMELLVTRRVLEQSESKYEVHPALGTVLRRTLDDSE
jgi:Cdc6-like AAA superfamily ATPase